MQAAGDALIRPHADCYWVVPGRLLAGEHPAPHLASLHAAGITDFVDLTAEGEGVPDYGPALGPGLSWRRFGIADYTVPSPALMREILDHIGQLLSAPGRVVYLHCQGGVGRTGTVVGCLLVEAGVAPPQALDELARKWRVVAKRARAPESPETADQRTFVLGWVPGGR